MPSNNVHDSLCMMCSGCQVLPVEPASTRGRGGGVAGGLVVVLLQPLGSHLGKLLTQVEEVQSREVLVDGIKGHNRVKGHTWSELPGATVFCVYKSTIN